MPTDSFLQNIECCGSKCEHGGNKTALDITRGVWAQLPKSSPRDSDASDYCSSFAMKLKRPTKSVMSAVI